MLHLKMARKRVFFSAFYPATVLIKPFDLGVTPRREGEERGMVRKG